MDALRSKVRDFLHKWLNDNKIPHIRKGMVEEMEQFVNSELSDAQIRQITEKMAAQKMVQDLPPNQPEEALDEKDPE